MVTFARKQMVRGDNNQLLFLFFFFCIGSDEVVAFLWSAYLWSSCPSGIPFALGSSPGAVSPSYPPLTTNSRHLDVHRPCPALPCPAAAMALALWARDLTRSCLTEKDAGDFSWFLSLFHFSKKKKKKSILLMSSPINSASRQIASKERITPWGSWWVSAAPNAWFKPKSCSVNIPVLLLFFSTWYFDFWKKNCGFIHFSSI